MIYNHFVCFRLNPCTDLLQHQIDLGNPSGQFSSIHDLLLTL